MRDRGGSSGLIYFVSICALDYFTPGLCFICTSLKEVEWHQEVIEYVVPCPSFSCHIHLSFLVGKFWICDIVGFIFSH